MFDDDDDDDDDEAVCLLMLMFVALTLKQTASERASKQLNECCWPVACMKVNYHLKS